MWLEGDGMGAGYCQVAFIQKSVPGTVLSSEIPQGLRQFLLASCWSSRKTAPDSWGGGQPLSCPGSHTLPCLALRPTSKTFHGSLSTGGLVSTPASKVATTES